MPGPAVGGRVVIGLASVIEGTPCGGVDRDGRIEPASLFIKALLSVAECHEPCSSFSEGFGE
jgi:hypothetical protein